jgi:hypothetical protein
MLSPHWRIDRRSLKDDQAAKQYSLLAATSDEVVGALSPAKKRASAIAVETNGGTITLELIFEANASSVRA